MKLLAVDARRAPVCGARAEGWRVIHRDSAADQRSARCAVTAAACISDAAAGLVASAGSSQKTLRPRVRGDTAAGRAGPEIGERLHLSVKTVSTHKTHILEKLSLGSTAELVRYALEHKLVQ